MTKRVHVLVPKPKSKFQKVQCKECSAENILYSHVTTTVTCKSCGNIIAEPTGSVAKIHGTVLGILE
jgi:small subunit ribosomal protein S27e